MTIKHGFRVEEICNRNGCKGVIEADHGWLEACYCYATDFPPCAYCEVYDVCCPECEWHSDDGEVIEVEAVKYPNICFCGSKAWINFKENFQCVNQVCPNYEGKT